MKEHFRDRGKNCYILEPEGEMKVPVKLFLSPELFKNIEPEALKQLVDAATLPGVCGVVIGMPDIHKGYGLPIGGVLATDFNRGIVSSGAVGMDINCGVRLVATDLSRGELKEKALETLKTAIPSEIPLGVGSTTMKYRLNKKAMNRVFLEGAKYWVERGIGDKGDLQVIEEGGSMEGADPDALSSKARERSDQLATLGGGNHFIEIGFVEKVINMELAEEFGLFEEQVTVMIHTGSRGLGHQVCTDFVEKFLKKGNIKPPSKGLACALISSKSGQEYLKAMRCAVNYAFANRHLIDYEVRAIFSSVVSSSIRFKLIYDLAHNIAKIEEHHGGRLLVHRKGAVRGLPAGHPQNPPVYRKTGHPVIVPGSMGSASYVLVGTEAARETFYSVNHGAGRVMSRNAARKKLSKEEISLRMKGIKVNKNLQKVADEAPQAYKDIDLVTESLADAGIVERVARLKPLLVLKG